MQVSPTQRRDAFPVDAAPHAEPPALIVCDRAGRVQRSNAAWSRLFGETAAGVPSLFDARLYADAEQGVQALLRWLAQGGGVADALVLPLVRQDGSPFAGRVQCSTLELGGHTWYSAWITEEAPRQGAAQQSGDELLLGHLLAGAVTMADGRLLRANAM